MRNLLIKILFKILDNDFETEFSENDMDDIHDWFIHCKSHPGYRKYVEARNVQLLREFANGLSNKSAETWRGQRMELLSLGDRVDKATKREKNKDKMKVDIKNKNKNNG